MRNKNRIIEKGKEEILGRQMSWEMVRSEKKSAFGIQGSRIYELNLYRDGTMTADYRNGWIKTPSDEDEPSILCIQHLVDTFGKEKKKKEKKKND